MERGRVEVSKNPAKREQSLPAVFPVNQRDLRNEPPVVFPVPDTRASAVTIVILACNEARHLPRCLAQLPRGYRVVVVDSGSTDATPEIAEAHGCDVYTRAWQGFAEQRNFALRECGVRTPWVLFVDADEIYPADFFDWFESEVAERPAIDAVWVPSYLHLRGKRLAHAPGYPIYHPRAIRVGKVHFVTNHTGHGESIPATTATITAAIPYDHYFYDGDIVGWMHKHIGKALLEVGLKRTAGAQLSRRGKLSLLLGRSALRIPARFLYHYVLRGGFLDGRAGFEFALMFTWYEATIYLQHNAQLGNSHDEAS
ncbi:MAG: glycosyltransferase family 2 protein [Pseudomonadota bacterium]